MPHSPDEKKRIIARLRRIKGQAQALERAVEEGADCGALLQQIAALRGATNGLTVAVINSHMHELFGTTGMPSRPDPVDTDAEIDSLMKILRAYLK